MSRTTRNTKDAQNPVKQALRDNLRDYSRRDTRAMQAISEAESEAQDDMLSFEFAPSFEPYDN